MKVADTSPIFSIAFSLCVTLAASTIATAQQGGQRFAGQTLKVATWGGSTGKAHRDATPEFEKATGAKIEWSEGTEIEFLAQLLAAKGSTPPYDLINITDVLEPQAINQSLIIKPDYSKIPNAKLMSPDLVSHTGYGPVWHYLRFVIAYLPEKFREASIQPPKDLSILAEPKLANRVAIPDVTQPNWGAGVAPSLAAFYGHSLNDPGPTLAKLAAIKGLVLYNSSSDLEARMLSGEIWVSVWTDGRVNGLKAKGAKIEIAPMGIPNPKGGTFEFVAGPAMIQITNPAKKELAEAFINHMLGTEFQVAYARGTLYSPVNVEALKIVRQDPKKGSYFDTGGKLYTPDFAAWEKAQDRWIDAWGKALRR